MTTYDSSAHGTLRDSAEPHRTVDLAGTQWPVYKLQALFLGALVFLAALVMVGVVQTAVLAAASATVLTWWGLRIAERGLPRS